MNKKIFRSTFFTSVIVLLISTGLVFGVLYEHFENQIFAELKSEAAYIEYGIEADGEKYIQNFNNQEKRITLVDLSGRVLADTAADVSSLDNHAGRKEIMEAIETGEGKSSRYSDTLTEKTLYYAKKISSGYIVRVSTTQRSVASILLGLIQPSLIVLMCAMIISFVLSKRLSNAIIKPINSLDLENVTNNTAYDELTPLLGKIAHQKRTIDLQIKAARQKQEEFKLITENMSEGLLIIDKNMNVLTSNRAARELFEADADYKGGVLQLNRTRGFREAVDKALSGERYESLIATDAKSYELIATPAFEEKKVIGAVIVIIDVTEREKREQLRREFTSNVSHELKTPLTSISGFAEVLRAGSVPESTVTDFSGSIYDEAQRLIALVADIIKISEFEEKTDSFEKEEVDLFLLAERVAERLKPQAEKRNITLVVKGCECIVNGSMKVLEEIVYNLCDNAIKYNKDNGSVTVTTESYDSSVVLTVADTGIGIPLKDQDRIFERFYRVDKSHSKEIGGTGLGLSIVKHAVNCHGGTIKLVSSEGEGTTITVILDK